MAMLVTPLSTAPDRITKSSLRDEEPIAAVSTASGAAAVAIIRLTGTGCHELLGKVVRYRKSIQPPARRLVLASIIDPDTDVVIDEPLVVLFSDPASFTGQDAAEIHCHGGPWIVNRTMAILRAAGFRNAEPGEFTRRAFLREKLDLTTAEGIRELVNAESHQEWLAARQLATGRLRELIDELRNDLIAAMAWLEARIDFPDEGDTAGVEIREVRTRVERVEATLKKLAATRDSGRVAAKGLLVALYGLPNAGKSTLMNALLGTDRAIVSPHAGTTRDWIEERCLINGRLIRLVDMAGVRDSVDAVEKIGIDRAREFARDADVVIDLQAVDGDPVQQKSTSEWLTANRQNRSVVRCQTKIDMAQGEWETPGEIAISCTTGKGLDQLRDKLAGMVDVHVATVREEICLSSPRHVAAIESAIASLGRFHAAADRAAYEEMLAFELLEAARSLESIVGVVASDEVLGKIFSDFCIGK